VSPAFVRRSRQWLDHRREVLVRRNRHRLAAVEGLPATEYIDHFAELSIY